MFNTRYYYITYRDKQQGDGCKCGNSSVVREERNGNENEDEGMLWKLELL